jgi:hypothetical protein
MGGTYDCPAQPWLEEPYALMHARTGLREPRAGNRPWPPRQPPIYKIDLKVAWQEPAKAGRRRKKK